MPAQSKKTPMNSSSEFHDDSSPPSDETSYDESSHAKLSTDHATTPPSCCTPSGLVHDVEDEVHETDSEDNSGTKEQPQAVAFDASNVEYRDPDDGSHVSLPDLSPKQYIGVYHLPPKTFVPWKAMYNSTEPVHIISEMHFFRKGGAVSLHDSRDQYDWTSKELVLELLDGPTKVVAKEHRRWSDYSQAKARGHAFERAHSNRYVAMMLNIFREELFNIWAKKESSAVRQMYKDACFIQVQLLYVLQTVGNKDKGASQWLIAESGTDTRNHRYIYEYEFVNKNYKMKVDQSLEDVIYAFAHYTFKKSGGLSLIAQLDCDAHGKLSNLVCFTKVNPPDVLCFQGMFNIIEMAFVHFERHHKCNNVCHTLGLKAFNPFK
ncbi:hypothetical protein DFH28DRAFT_939766 [Melampsora americana]|nr:hypothetical protein DFH28DRAFT_939766 [Melampsora americana]